jgi:hypothetical protein
VIGRVVCSFGENYRDNLIFCGNKNESSNGDMILMYMNDKYIDFSPKTLTIKDSSSPTVVSHCPLVVCFIMIVLEQDSSPLFKVNYEYAIWQYLSGMIQIEDAHKCLESMMKNKTIKKNITLMSKLEEYTGLINGWRTFYKLSNTRGGYGIKNKVWLQEYSIVHILCSNNEEDSVIASDEKDKSIYILSKINSLTGLCKSLSSCKDKSEIPYVDQRAEQLVNENLLSIAEFKKYNIRSGQVRNKLRDKEIADKKQYPNLSDIISSVKEINKRDDISDNQELKVNDEKLTKQFQVGRIEMIKYTEAIANHIEKVREGLGEHLYDNVNVVDGNGLTFGTLCEMMLAYNKSLTESVIDLYASEVEDALADNVTSNVVKATEITAEEVYYELKDRVVEATEKKLKEVKYASDGDKMLVDETNVESLLVLCYISPLMKFEFQAFSDAAKKLFPNIKIYDYTHYTGSDKDTFNAHIHNSNNSGIVLVSTLDLGSVDSYLMPTYDELKAMESVLGGQGNIAQKIKVDQDIIDDIENTVVHDYDALFVRLISFFVE